MDIVIITTVADIVQRLLAHMCEDAHATRQLLRCQCRCGPFHAKRAANAAITFYNFLLLERL